MTNGWRSIALTVVLAALAAAGGAWLCASYVVTHHAPTSLHEVVHKHLKLRPDQARRLDDIEARYAVDRSRLEDEIRAANRELAAAIQKGHKDSPEVEAAIDHLHMAMGALQKATIAHVFDMRAVLDAEQTKTFDAEVVSSLTAGDR